MESVFVAWSVSALVLLLLAWVLGKAICHHPLGVLIDSRGRFSLTHLQIVAWSIVILSLISGVFFGRLVDGPAGKALDFEIPDQLLLVMGISIGSTAVATAIKTTKDTTNRLSIAASDEAHPPRLAQIFLLEEGAMADQVIDVSKFQNFVITVVLVVAYVALTINALDSLSSINQLTALPAFNDTFVALLAISHGGYLIGKVPNGSGEPVGLTLAQRDSALRTRALEAASGS